MTSLKFVAPDPCEMSCVPNNSTVATMSYKKPSNFEIFNACINDLTGKDKIAKSIQYLLRLLTSVNEIHGLGNPKVSRSMKSEFLLSSTDIVPSIKTGSPLLSKTNRLLLILLAFLVKRFSSFLNGVSVFRHLLRFGSLPLRFYKFFNHLKHTLKTLMDNSDTTTPIKLQKILNYWTSKDMLSQILNFWYALSDELLLIFRFNLLLRNKDSTFNNRLFAWAEDHELYSWLGLILFGLNNDFNNFINLREQESKIKLNQKVKSRTKKIVNDLKNKNKIQRGESPSDLFGSDNDQNEMEELLKIDKEITRIKINSVRLFCDLIFDSKYVFNINMYKPLHISFGFISGLLGLYNVWRQQRDRLENDAKQKAMLGQ